MPTNWIKKHLSSGKRSASSGSAYDMFRRPDSAVIIYPEAERLDALPLPIPNSNSNMNFAHVRRNTTESNGYYPGPRESISSHDGPGELAGTEGVRHYELGNYRNGQAHGVPTASGSNSHLQLNQPLAAAAAGVPYEDDAYLDQLEDYNVVFLVDDSESMRVGNRWTDTYDLLQQLIPVAAHYSKKGTDVHFINDKSRVLANQRVFSTALTAWNGMRRSRITKTATALERILSPYIRELDSINVQRATGLNVIVITTGKSSDDKGLEQVIVGYAKDLDDLAAPKCLVGIQFVQMGTDADAAVVLNKFDNQLEVEHSIKRDIVDTRLFRQNATLTRQLKRMILLGAINKSIDELEDED
ncbi:hypothetical protein H072_2157 [Dactylellina haptotyla CBS 200.50]|uniref:VWFA domain-containing protein n=1 Tax=Dactylellina haptotyla (strain CBS 200.50) TaxID=1284197 RepID=S8ASG4_DACHA|nr:hypothetical protein H072_2157 [Dactylellina haptotyla CBS 200.50]